jgi:hypothetical protein
VTRLVYFEETSSSRSAFSRERQIKVGHARRSFGWSKSEVRARVISRSFIGDYTSPPDLPGESASERLACHRPLPVLREVQPPSVHRFHQPHLSLARPPSDLANAINGELWSWGFLEVDEPGEPLFVSEARHLFLPVSMNPAEQVTSHPGVKATGAVRHDVDKESGA